MAEALPLAGREEELPGVVREVGAQVLASPLEVVQEVMRVEAEALVEQALTLVTAGQPAEQQEQTDKNLRPHLQDALES